MKTVIFIPARMASQRFPNKPMALINGVPMIERVWKQAIKSNIGDVFVACSENEVFDHILSKGGKAIITDPNLPSGTDRIYQALHKVDNSDQFDSIINLQGDMPIISPDDISKVNKPQRKIFTSININPKRVLKEFRVIKDNLLEFLKTLEGDNIDKLISDAFSQTIGER